MARIVKTHIAPVLLLVLCFTGCEKMLLGPEPDNTPRSNFEILWKTFDENYALFPVKPVNWDSLHVVFGSQIKYSTTEAELWNTITGLIAQLNDGHVSLINKGYTAGFNSSVISKRNRADFSLDVVKNRFLAGYQVAGDGYFVYGRIKPDFSASSIGYIYIASFASSPNTGSTWAYDIDRIVRELNDCDAMIIDLRNNGGGLKVTGAVIASAFIDRNFTYFYQQEKTGPGHNDFGSPIPLTISVRPGVLRYNKKIALLTNRFSASGSEHFTQVFRYLSYATQIGDTTFGCFGDILQTAQLPNGWTYLYPCRLTKTPEGKCYEGLGMIPDILVENTKADIDAGRDNVMDRAITFLSN